MLQNIIKSLHLKRSILLDFIGTLSLAIVTIISGNISAIFSLNIETEIIMYSFISFASSNWLGINNAFLIKNSFLFIRNKIAKDLIYLIIIATVLSAFFQHPILKTVIVSLAIYHFSVYGNILRNSKSYCSYANLQIFSHIFLLGMYIYEKEIAVIFLCLFLISINYKILKALKIDLIKMFIPAFEKKNYLNTDDWIYIKIYSVGIILGDIDKYYIAYFIDPKIAIYYLTISSITGLVPIFLSGTVSAFKNEKEISKEMMKKIWWIFILTILIALFSILINKNEGNYIILVSLISSVIFKYFYVIKSFPQYILLYKESRINAIYSLMVKTNIYSFAVNQFYFIYPSYLISVIAKVISSYPLYQLSKYEKDNH
jgi:hypothetical protein